MKHGKEALAARYTAILESARLHFGTLALGDGIGAEKGYGLGGIDAIALYLLERDGTPVGRTHDTSWDMLRLLLCRELKAVKGNRKADFGKLESSGRKTAAGSRWAALNTEADRAYDLECFGDELAKRHQYPSGGMEAIWLHVVDLHHWPLHEARSLSHASLRFLLAHRMRGWTISIEQVRAKRSGDEAQRPQISGTSVART